MPGFGSDSPFGQITPTDLSAMLQAAYAAQPAAPGLDYMPLPGPHQDAQAPIQLGGVQVQKSGLESLGEGLQGASQMVGSAMAARGAANPTTQGAGGWSNTSLPGSNITAPQLGAPAPFSVEGLNQALSAPSQQFSLGNPAIKPLFSFKG